MRVCGFLDNGYSNIARIHLIQNGLLLRISQFQKDWSISPWAVRGDGPLETLLHARLRLQLSSDGCMAMTPHNAVHREQS